MQTIKKRLIITGLIVLIGLTIRIDCTYAIYSPRLSKQASVIRQHILDSQSQNGAQSILENIEQFKAYDKARRDAFEATGISGEARVAQNLIFETTLGAMIKDPVRAGFDSLFMVFNFNYPTGEWISACLRDDIWSLDTLRDMVGAEMLKAYMLRDTLHGALLMEDYKYLSANLDLLRNFGSKPNAKIQATDASGKPVTITSTKYFFGNSGTDPNYYKNVPGWISNETGCPESEFQEAFKEVVNSWETLSGIVGDNSLFSNEKWGSLMAMAQANARAKAKQWIKANQLSLTLGGEVGGRAESLVKGGGWDKFVGSVKAQWEIMKDAVGPFTPFYDAATNYQAPSDAEDVGTNCRFFHQSDGYFRVCNKDQIEQYDKCNDKKTTEDEKKEIRCDRFRNAEETISIVDKLNDQVKLMQENADMLEDAENAFVYSITMDSVAEQNIYFMDEILWDINMNIKRGYEAVDKNAGKGIPTLYKKIATLAAKQCANKKK